MFAALFGLGGPEMIALLVMGGLVCGGTLLALAIVFFVTQQSKKPDRFSVLEEENRRLREEIARLEENK
jgi:cell shape-determining protein MreC